MRRALLATSLLLGSLAATAENGVLVTQIPAGADRATMLNVVRHTLERREWIVQSTGPNSVTAKISGGNFDSTITITVGDNAIAYEGTAIRHVSIAGAPAITNPCPIPPRWLRTLRIDIGEEVAAMPAK
jgi:hypothetical protein